MFQKLRTLAARSLSALSRSLEDPQLSLTDPDGWDDMFDGGGRSVSGERVSRRTALTLSALYRGVGLISGTVGKIPCYCWRGTEEKKERDIKHPSHRLVRWNANPEMTAFTLRETMTAHAILQGGGFAYIKRAPDGTPLRLNLLLPDRTYPVRVNGQLYYVTSIGGTLEDKHSEMVTLFPDEVLHIHGLGFDGLTGYSVIELAKTDFGAAIAKVKHEATFFRDAMTPHIIIEVPKQMTAPAYARLKASWKRSLPGNNRDARLHETALLEEGAKANPIQVSAADAQLIESRKFDLVSASNWLHLPPHKLGGEGRAAYASLEQENQSTLDEAFDPWFVRWELECRRKLLTTEEQESESHFFEFVREALLRSNLAARASYYRMALGGRPWMLQNEVRRRENMPPVPGGDVMLDPLNMGKQGGNPDEPQSDDLKPKDGTNDETQDDTDENGQPV